MPKIGLAAIAAVLADVTLFAECGAHENGEVVSAAAWPVLRTYRGEFLRRVKMPVGGIGTGVAKGSDPMDGKC